MPKRPVVVLAGLGSTLCNDLEAYLERRGYETLICDEEWEIRSQAEARGTDVIVVGDGIADSTTLSMLRRFQSKDDPAVIILRPPKDLVETVLALEMGAADVVATPTELREIAARIGSLVARRGKQGPDLVALENSTVDLRSALVMHKSGSEEQLSPGQVALLRLFLANPRRVLTRDDIMAEAPAESTEAFDRSIDSRIVRLRRKLDTERIVTIRGAGYRFDPLADTHA
jgi:two-component system OmpR family response regulator